MADETKDTTSQDSQNQETITTEETQTTTSETPEETTEEKVEEVDDDTKQAIGLYNALKDPQTAVVVIRTLAERLGLDVGTKKEAKAAQQTIEDIFRESLGSEYAFLADKIAPAVERAVNLRLQEVNSKLQEQEQKATEREVEDALSYLNRTTKGEAKKFEGRIVKLMDQFLPAPGQKTRDYIKGLYNIAAAESREKAIQKGMADKINQNAADVGSRLQTSGLDDSRAKGPAKLSLRQSVEAAVQAATNKQG